MLAFKEAYDFLNSAPTPPAFPAASASTSFRDTLRVIERDFARDVAKWRSDLLTIREDVKSAFASMIELSGNPHEPLNQLQQLIVFSEQMLDEREKLYKNLSSELTAEAERLSLVSRDDGRAFRKSVRRYLDLVVEEYDNRASFLTFLKRLHADHDPEARGGPTFDNAEDLIADLRG